MPKLATAQEPRVAQRRRGGGGNIYFQYFLRRRYSICACICICKKKSLKWHSAGAATCIFNIFGGGENDNHPENLGISTHPSFSWRMVTGCLAIFVGGIIAVQRKHKSFYENVKEMCQCNHLTWVGHESTPLPPHSPSGRSTTIGVKPMPTSWPHHHASPSWNTTMQKTLDYMIDLSLVPRDLEDSSSQSS